MSEQKKQEAQETREEQQKLKEQDLNEVAGGGDVLRGLAELEGGDPKSPSAGEFQRPRVFN